MLSHQLRKQMCWISQISESSIYWHQPRKLQVVNQRLQKSGLQNHHRKLKILSQMTRHQPGMPKLYNWFAPVQLNRRLNLDTWSHGILSWAEEARTREPQLFFLSAQKCTMKSNIWMEWVFHWNPSGEFHLSTCKKSQQVRHTFLGKAPRHRQVSHQESKTMRERVAAIK